MKKKIVYLLIAVVAAATGCNNNTYSNLRDKEDKLIANYISRNGLTIVNEEPAEDHVWGEKEYYMVKGYDNFYFHLISRGDSIYVDSISPTRKDTVDLSIVLNDVIITRYKRFSLTEDADTLSYWTTLEQAYPYEFHYGNTSDCECVAWHLAVQMMKYPDSQCEIIVPSKMGFSDEQSTVTPYVYILKIKVKQ
ncbi:MAG: DUF4827 family protein [Paludibacteraceae bacterium]|nr:DUF4827 family protein [Paludibacteraceae bacterium]MBQ2520349.1 DUF4827 family protein [Paludibacteraceae bacterium]MBQ4018989.1 DUF4827 family protein [Paludibacteraceae bacterium]MBQ5378903.1 DUF4827 family protein [Paludibacteraceae bacterium]